ncbi:uncharacterized protein BDZ99DRAFT_458560 [Mytilinidion resinicola]|uniref:Transposase MuDR plant domain-containing protein n=1 Tax=Mytilinidion resinicola TaxID=574789 RepID=A0A6A6Z163_9PEZI|nr:uncharacterized protein BDZ99DRAFT_458560 [Mytilinidion resinicola]KAF2814538.1 hypothetical protein BDZ99DRAFT_458560 [Mytilinidion resinicola]
MNFDPALENNDDSQDDDSEPSPNNTAHGDAPPPDLDVPIPVEGSSYTDWEALRYAINAWALRDKFKTRIHKKDSTRAVYHCKYEKRTKPPCTWRIRANVSRPSSSTPSQHPPSVVVTVVQPFHTCNPDEHVEDDKYWRRGVQFTQRWVRDSLARCGFQVSVDTAPAEIVQVIKERFGEDIEEKLAKKAKTSLLVMRGDIQPPARGKTQRAPGVNRGGRPSKAMLEERKRVAEAEAHMQRRRAMERERREREGLPPLNDHELMLFVEGEGHGQSQAQGAMALAMQAQQNPAVVTGGEDFVFESGERILGPVQQYLVDEARAGTTETEPAPAFHSHSIPGGARAVVPMLASGSSRPCETCSGTGVVSVPGRAGGRSQEDDELNVLKNQVTMLAKQISLMQNRRERAG